MEEYVHYPHVGPCPHFAGAEWGLVQCLKPLHLYNLCSFPHYFSIWFQHTIPLWKSPWSVTSHELDALLFVLLIFFYCSLNSEASSSADAPPAPHSYMPYYLYNYPSTVPLSDMGIGNNHSFRPPFLPSSPLGPWLYHSTPYQGSHHNLHMAQNYQVRPPTSVR